MFLTEETSLSWLRTIQKCGESVGYVMSILALDVYAQRHNKQGKVIRAGGAQKRHPTLTEAEQEPAQGRLKELG